MNAALEAKTANLVAEAEEVLVSVLVATGISRWGMFPRSYLVTLLPDFNWYVKSEFNVPVEYIYNHVF